MIKIEYLSIYPLKSAQGIKVDTLSVVETGPKFDRHWMVIDEKNQFLSLRREPKFAQIQQSLKGNQLTLNAPGMEEISFQDQPIAEPVLSKLLIYDVPVSECSKEASEWMSAFLQKPCRVVVKANGYKRLVREKYALTKDDQVDLADGYPFLVAFQEELDELNSRLDQPVEMERFRPNIVLSGGGRFFSKTVKKLQIGDVVIQLVKPCSRCAAVNVEPETAYKSSEPLKTLSQYRKINGKITFGMNGIAENLGVIRQNSPVKILEMVT